MFSEYKYGLSKMQKYHLNHKLYRFYVALKYCGRLLNRTLYMKIALNQQVIINMLLCEPLQINVQFSSH